MRQFAITASLIGALLSVVLWGMSYLKCGMFLSATHTLICLSHGAIYFSHTSAAVEVGTLDFDRVGNPTFVYKIEPDGAGQSNWWCLGFDGLGTKWTTRSANLIPLWLPTIVCTFLWLILTRAHTWYQRSLANCCIACGYDLRGSLTRCPECGLPFGS